MTAGRALLLAGALLATTTAVAANTTEPSKPTGTLIDFQAQAERTASNDLGRVNAYFEASGANPGELARKVNGVMAAALATAKGEPAVKVRSGATHTYPIYTKGSRQIESWRMRSELLLESRETAPLSDLVGKLQTTLAVGHIGFVPAPETRRRAEDEAALDALTAFQEKAARYAAALKQPYRIRSLTIGSHGTAPPAPSFRALAMSAEAAPMPVEAGESTVVVTINGQIELGGK